jgi:hypothetical protein
LSCRQYVVLLRHRRTDLLCTFGWRSF